MSTIQENLSLTISPQSNVLDGIVLYEPCDVVILEKLIHSTLLLLKFNNKMAGIQYENEKQQLIKYKEKFTDGRAKIRYQRSKGNPYGRSNPIGALGLYPIRRQIRHTLAKGRFADYDVKNCHPDMKLQICLKNKVTCTELQKYVTFRQRYFDLTVESYGCSEEQAKNLYIVYLNGGGIEAWVINKKIDVSKVKPDYVKNGKILEVPDNELFRLEQIKINQIIMDSNSNLKETVLKNRKEQGKTITEEKLACSCCAYFLQEYEIRVLEQMYIYCIEHKYIEEGNCVLCADGLMLEKKFVSDNILTEFETVIYEKLGFKLTITQKEMDNDYLEILDKNVIFDYLFDIQTFHNIVIGENYKEDTTELEILKLKLAKLEEMKVNDKKMEKEINMGILNEIKISKMREESAVFYRRKTYFEMFHFKVMSPFCLARKVERGFEFIPQETFNKCYKNLEKDFPMTWLSSKHIRTYENCDFCPPPNYINNSAFNLFHGLDGEKLIFNNKGSNDKLILGKQSNIFIKQLWYLTGKNNLCLEYCLDYLAHLIQKPGELPRVALLFKSDQGVGKNVFFEQFTNKLINKKYLLVTADLDHIIGRFTQINQKLVVLMDEAKGKDTFTGSDRIKAFITAPTLIYEKKGIDGMTINNCSRMIFFTNNDYGVKIEQSDRRFVVMECATDFMNNTTYFNTLLKAFNTEAMVTNLYLFLKHRDITNFDSTNQRPVTQLYLEMKTATLPQETRYFIGRYDTWSSYVDTTPIITKKGKEHYDDYTFWCANLPYEHKPIAELTFIKRLNDNSKNEFITKCKKEDTTYYKIDVANLGVFVKKNTMEYEEIPADIFPDMYSEDIINE